MKLSPAWDDVSYVRVGVTDEKGVVNPNAYDKVTFKIDGPGVIAALDSGDLDSHETGSKQCPLFFNEERDFEQIAGRQRFDKGCRKKLKRLGAKLDALDALLNVFP